MLLKNNISIIFDEGPIARTYLEIFNKENIEFENIIILLSSSFFKQFNLRKKFLIKNYFPLKYLKDKKLNTLINQMETFFGFEKGFCEKIYKFSNLKLQNHNIKFINSDNINSIELTNCLNTFKEKKFFLNTTNQILKAALENKHEFIHIHPGFLPFVRGIDGSLWSIKERNKFGVTSFFINNKIDKGKIIKREEFDFLNFYFQFEKNYSNYEKYCIWYSFLDPLLRGFHLKKIMDLNFDEFKKDIDISEDFKKSKYYKKMDSSNLNIVFNKIFENRDEK